MALGTERALAVSGLWARVLEWLTALAKQLAVPLSVAGHAIAPVFEWARRHPVVRFFSKSLLRRILVSNLIGLGIIIGGIHYMGQYHAWLIDAKRESLKIQGEIIAAAIAANATVETDGVVVDTDKLADRDQPQRPLFNDFAALELSIRPERVTPILRKLIQPTQTRARIYGLDGTLIVDTAKLLSRGQIARGDPVVSHADDTPKTKNFWTRLKAWLIDKELPVYKEIGSAKGTAYKEVQRALNGETTAMLLLNDRGEQMVSLAVPIQRMKAVQGVLLLSTRPGDIDRILREERSVIWTLAAVAALATFVTSLLLSRTVVDPMRRLSAAAEHVSRNITARHELPEYNDRTDEVGQMASAFGNMTAALYRRIEASENFAADVAHELKNPLTAARSTAEALAYAKSEQQRSELVGQIQGELQRLNRLITDVSATSRLDAELARQEMQPVNLTVVLENVVKIFREILQANTRSVSLVIEHARVDADQAFMIYGNDSRIGQVVTNLIDNAISFSPEAGVVIVRARHEGRTVEVTIEDEGPGIPEDRLEIIFDRFYTDRPATEALRGKNSGLGLSISREIMRSHSGEIFAENLSGEDSAGNPRRGSRFTIRLPAHRVGMRGGASGGRRN
jgi:two-component system sensor histidine kinase ChvG